VGEVGFLNPLGSLFLLGILMFIVYRILATINSGHTDTQSGPGAEVIRMPQRRSPAAPPATITLNPMPEDQSPFHGNEEATDIHETMLDKGGMLFIGDFSISEMPGYNIRAYTHPEFCMSGVLYHDPEGKMWVSLTTKYKDGRVITSSSAEEGQASGSRPRGMPLFNHPGMAVDQLLRRHKLEIRVAEKEDPIAPEKFTEFFAENYARLREGVAEAEKEAEAEAMRTGSIISMPGAVDVEEESEPNARQLADWLNKIYAAYPVPKEKRKQFQRGLVWVAENAGMPSISKTISKYAGVKMDEVGEGRWVIRSKSGAEDIIEEGALKGPALFEKINACLPAGKRFTRLPVSIEGVAFYNRMAAGQ